MHSDYILPENKEFLEKSIDLLIKIIKQKILLSTKDLFVESKKLLCIALVKKYKTMTFEMIKKQIISHKNSDRKKMIQVAIDIYQYIKTNNLEDPFNYEYEYKKQKNIYFN